VTADHEDASMALTSDHTGILIVRLWIEGNAREGFRARITRTLDSAGHEQEMATAAAPDDIYAVVRTWVEAFVAQETLACPVTLP
jgi:antitoxin component HigA of HigAB toxin-antitoxin module